MRFSPHTPTRSRAESPPTRAPRRDGRVREIDVLRGFALLGILLVNVQAMAGPHMGPGGQPITSRADEVAAWLVTALVGSKFYLLFSFLFGYSFILQWASAERAGVAFAPRHVRRLACLFLLGLAHGVLLFDGDVLMIYAVLGLVLFAVRDIAPRTAVWAAAWFVAGASVCLLARGLITVAFSEPARPQDIAAWGHEMVTAYRGDPGSIVQANLQSLRGRLGGNIVYSADVLAAFLVGLAAGTRGVLAAPFRYRARMVRIVAWGLPIGLAGSVFMAVCRDGPLDSRWYDVGSAVGVLTAPALTAAYVCGLLLLLHTRPGRRVGDALAPAGRLALTNYLTQSLVMALVFTGYGLAGYGRYGTVAVLAGCCVLYAAQLAFSRWLTRHVGYGPAEWLLRAVTLAHRP
ncbi:DUF418 domain-containing protein [Streptomyces sp. NBC_00286]|uniref:DUF418 domain-containing protein n=1 Tax=Streptomyces sp. NBC_00286 TaxID=2975701 RepID=UPI002E2D72A0|nr:DUF418 domain-containing protein [Streptomyces sp. NBC_00286]